jgi:hypothetical protein
MLVCYFHFHFRIGICMVRCVYALRAISYVCSRWIIVLCGWVREGTSKVVSKTVAGMLLLVNYLARWRVCPATLSRFRVCASHLLYLHHAPSTPIPTFSCLWRLRHRSPDPRKPHVLVLKVYTPLSRSVRLSHDIIIARFRSNIESGDRRPVLGAFP